MLRLSLVFGVVLMSGLIGSTGSEEHTVDNPGAALLWTSGHPTIVHARRLIEAGDFTKAEALIRDGSVFMGEGGQRTRDESLETIRRVRREFSQTEEELVAAVRKTIEDFTADDLRRLVDEGQVICREIDGELGYYRREPGVMYRFSDEVKRRRTEWDARRAADEGAVASSAPLLDEDRSNFTLNNHLAEVVEAGQAAAEAGGSPIVLPRRFRVRYTLTVLSADEQTDTELMREGSQLSVWLPFPQAYRQQSDVVLVSATIDDQPYQPQIAPNATDFDGSLPIGGSTQRTTYFQTTVADPGKPTVFEQVFEYSMAGHYPVITAENTRELTDGERVDFADYLAERPPHIVFNYELAGLADQLVGDETNPYLKAKALFDWWDANIRWLPEFEYATIPSFADLCMKRKRGDCGVQSLTLVSMMRSVGIPARWQSGFTTTPGKENLHDWSEIYLPPHGWVVADPSYGYRTSDNPEIKHFYLGHMDAYRIIINLDYGRALVPPKKSLRSEPADFQRGEVEIDGVNLYFDDWKWKYEVESIEVVE
jgi:transglutaminase-like putative cysteine protease